MVVNGELAGDANDEEHIKYKGKESFLSTPAIIKATLRKEYNSSITGFGTSRRCRRCGFYGYKFK